MRLLFFILLVLDVISARELPYEDTLPYNDQLRYYLDGREYRIDGKFYSYDFNKNGSIDYNDWIYMSNQKAYRLFGIKGDIQNPFGWEPIDLPRDFQSRASFEGYFVFIDYPFDTIDPYRSRAMSWVYVDKGGRIYKLLGKWGRYFRFLLLEGIEIEKKKGTLKFLTWGLSKRLEGEKSQKSAFEAKDAYFGYQKLEGVWTKFIFFSYPGKIRRWRYDGRMVVLPSGKVIAYSSLFLDIAGFIGFRTKYIDLSPYYRNRYDIVDLTQKTYDLTSFLRFKTRGREIEEIVREGVVAPKFSQWEAPKSVMRIFDYYRGCPLVEVEEGAKKGLFMLCKISD